MDWLVSFFSTQIMGNPKAWPSRGGTWKCEECSWTGSRCCKGLGHPWKKSIWMWLFVWDCLASMRYGQQMEFEVSTVLHVVFLRNPKWSLIGGWGRPLPSCHQTNSKVCRPEWETSPSRSIQVHSLTLGHCLGQLPNVWPRRRLTISPCIWSTSSHVWPTWDATLFAFHWSHMVFRCRDWEPWIDNNVRIKQIYLFFGVVQENATRLHSVQCCAS